MPERVGVYDRLRSFLRHNITFHLKTGQPAAAGVKGEPWRLRIARPELPAYP